MDISDIKNNGNIRLIKEAADDVNAKLYIIGGVLRDIMLGKKCSDYDFIVFGDLSAFTKSASKRLKRPVIRLGSGVKELYRIVRKGVYYDFTKPKGDTLNEDITKRDFTVNALAYSIDEGNIIDLCGAKEDINNRIIRIVSDTAFDEDPLRMLRAFRFSSGLGFAIQKDTLKLISQKSRLIFSTAGERIKDELFKIFSSDASYSVIRQMSDCGLLYEIFPELKASIGCAQNEYHHLDVMEHTLFAYKSLEDIFNRLPAFFVKTHKSVKDFFMQDENVNAKELIKYSILLHDVAKPMTKTTGDDGRIHFYKHCEEGEKTVRVINSRLKLSAKDDLLTRTVVKYHLRLISFINAVDEGAIPRKSVLRYFIRLKEAGVYVILHNLADLMAARGIKRAEKNEVKKLIRFSDAMLDIYFNEFVLRRKNPPLVTGRQLIEDFNLKPSPVFKEILSQVYEKQLSGEIKTVKEAYELVKSMI